MCLTLDLLAKIRDILKEPQAFENTTLSLALRHRSHNARENYERLEFLGDRVLAVVVAELLYRQFPNSSEGGLAKRHAELVSRHTLSDIGIALEIDPAVTLCGGTITQGIRADVIEAIIGALYLEGGLAYSRHFIEHFWQPLAIEMADPPDNPRGTLQEWAQQRGLPLPHYSEIERTGSDHHPTFHFRAQLGEQFSASSWGDSKQLAKTAAAQKLLKALLDKPHLS